MQLKKNVRKSLMIYGRSQIKGVSKGLPKKSEKIIMSNSWASLCGFEKKKT
jgi:hypothetical protein